MNDTKTEEPYTKDQFASDFFRGDLRTRRREMRPVMAVVVLVTVVRAIWAWDLSKITISAISLAVTISLGCLLWDLINQLRARSLSTKVAEALFSPKHEIHAAEGCFRIVVGKSRPSNKRDLELDISQLMIAWMHLHERGLVPEMKEFVRKA